MKLTELFGLFTNYKMGETSSQDVAGLAIDNREVEPNKVFIAVKGTSQDGHDFIGAAIKAGAIGLVVEDDSKVPSDYRGALAKVKDSREALAQLSSRFYGKLTEKMFCVGITGTNGKTSVSLMVEKILTDFEWPTGVMGTIDHHLGNKSWDSPLTTPDPITLNRRLYEFNALGAKASVFEVSSHALIQNRADSIEFDAVVFTNLTRDHLDYHGSMENYFQAKEKLFRELPWKTNKSCTAIVNANDPWGPKLSIAEKCEVITYGENQSDLQIQIISSDFSGTEFRVKTRNGDILAHLPMPGRHNVYNAVAAAAVGMAAGRSLDSSLGSLKSFTGVPGRLESVENDKGLHIFVDYAHTDDALKTVLGTLQNIRKSMGTKNKIITVFGCGGDRDRGKRPMMARAAFEHSDFVVVTSDNPRTEEPMSIIQDVLSETSSEVSKNRLEVEADRREAIRKAIEQAKSGDVILIAGKGHEDYQIIGKMKKDFSDVAVAKEILNGI